MRRLLVDDCTSRVSGKILNRTAAKIITKKKKTKQPTLLQLAINDSLVHGKMLDLLSKETDPVVLQSVNDMLPIQSI